MSAEGLGPQQMARIEELVQEIETLPDAKSRETAAELVQLLMDFYGQGLARMLAIAGNAESHVVDSYGQDPLVSQILMLHGLHPIDLPTRVEKRWRRCARCCIRTAATSNCSASKTAWCVCDSREAATAARRRR